MAIRPGDLQRVLAGSSDVSRVKAISDQDPRRQSDQAAAEQARKQEQARQKVQERPEATGVRREDRERRQKPRREPPGGAGGPGGQGKPDGENRSRRAPEDKRGERLDIVLGA